MNPNWFYVVSLGCARNLVDSEKFAGALTREGYHQTDDLSKAGLVIINTCGFIDDAKKESIETVLEMLDEKEERAKTVVFGCLVKRYMDDLRKSLPEVDLFLPLLDEKAFIREIRLLCPPGEVRAGGHAEIAFTPPDYRYIKISDGCINYCSYCAIPLIRGPLKSVPPAKVRKEAEATLRSGSYELNLVAQDITAYGADIYGKPALTGLIREILKIRRDFWLRLLYLYPTRIDSGLIDLLAADERIVRYLDIPVQHANSRILKLMNRNYTKDRIFKLVSLLRKKLPGVALRTSLIVGFPTETEREFVELEEFVREAGFDHLGVFEYSREESTAAYAMEPRVPARERRNRRKALMNIQKKIITARNRKLIGSVFPCLPEYPVDQYGAVWAGRLYSQAPDVDGMVYFTGLEKNPGRPVEVTITDTKDYDLIAKMAVKPAVMNKGR